MEDAVIKVENVSKYFKLPHEKNSSIKTAAVNFYKPRKKGYEMQKALSEISFEIKKGEFFGIIGRNGSGKSTLLKMLAGIYTPTNGSITVNGTLTPFIELGVGFNQELTGRENVYLNGALLGFNRKEMNKMYHDIVNFAELKRFMDQKLKNYSSGMQVRLAFSIAIRAKSDILLIDEVLAVGDQSFQEKCYEYFEQLKKTSKTVVFVSHDSSAIQRFCDRAVIINAGKNEGIGDPESMVLKYGALVAQADYESGKVDGLAHEHEGTGDVTIKEARLISSDGEQKQSVNFGEPFSIDVSYKLNKKIDDSVLIGVDIIDDQGISILGPNTNEIKNLEVILEGSGNILIDFPPTPLSPKMYSVTVGIFNKQGTIALDLVEAVTTFKVLGEPRHGKIHIEPRWSIDKSTK